MGNLRKLIDRTRFEFSKTFFLRPKCMELIRQRFAGEGDPVRMGAMTLAVSTIQDEGIEGAFAEAGVWRGDTSAYLHKLAPSRPFYLFDTFEGFPKADLTHSDARFKNTSVGMVLAKFENASVVVPRVGRFPDTALGLENETYAFVSIDFDLEGPTYAALSYFYPRLAPGGYLFLHDFNSEESEHGVAKGFARFSNQIPEAPVGIPDAWGSVIIRKCKRVSEATASTPTRSN